ncbi:unnamed protein product [Nyctereutes procyonoides]|uniref:(raccoon dog) hypothetical protein n=1 Tax=Nyctereutes procyonoides TaxID=34880 RepID=A0A811ZCJ8_NYCPR|nr:unnamed protein product [Nyctereutes procyonoides]
MAIMGRQYGLILPKKAQQLHPVLQKPSVFGNDSDDNDEISMSESLQREATKKQAMKQTQLEIPKALAEDSTVYEYDRTYDEIKKEQEKRMEKKIQREREMEKGEFDDKEAFRAEEEERKKRAAALEACLDVTKQKDLSGFYRHLLNQAVGKEEVPTCSFHEARSGIKEEKLRGYSDEVSSENRIIPREKCSLQTVVQVGENPDADSDFDVNSEDDEMEKNNKTSEGDSKHQRHSPSSSEEREHGIKCHTKRSKSRVHEKREDQHQERQSRDHENYYTDYSHWKRHEHKDKLRGRDQRERKDRDWKREKYSLREQERDRQRNEHDRHRRAYERKERYENSDKYRDREQQEINVQFSERNRDKKESSPNSRAKDKFLVWERSNTMRNMEKDKERNSEKPSSSETSLGAKHILTEGCQEIGKEQEKPHEVGNKFAKRSNEETVMSARDRHLAR